MPKKASDQKFLVDFSGTPFLQGTVGADVNRLNWRAEKLLAENLRAIEGKRILDIASHDGRFSYACLKLGAAHVVGVEGRQNLVDKANKSFKELAISPEKYKFITGDIFDYLPECSPGEFDTILCFGFFYHTIRQVELLRTIGGLNPDSLILDTEVHPQRQWMRWLRIVWRFRSRHLNPDKFLDLVRTTEADEIIQVATEDAVADSNAIDFSGTPFRESESKLARMALTFQPTSATVERLLDVHGFEFLPILWKDKRINNWHKLKHYKQKRRVSYLATLRADK